MGSDDLTLRVLIEIRDQQREQIGGLRTEMREQIGALRNEMREQLGEVRAEVAETNKRVEVMDGHLQKEFLAVSTVLTDVAHVMKGRRKLEARLDRCEREIDALKRKLG